VFSPIQLMEFSPRGGTVYCGRILGKDEQLHRLSSIGISTPRTMIFSPSVTFDPEEWGEYVIVKPNNRNSGVGVKLVRTVDLPARYSELTSEFNDQYLVQPYIDHAVDGHPAEYRILSMFGRALYCSSNRWENKRPPLAELAADPLGIVASNDKTTVRVRSICNDAEVISLGELAHQAFPECPVIGVDVIRDIKSGRLYILEANCHGEVWHLSSSLGKKYPALTKDFYAQFNALDLAADLLIQKTRSEAC
jgi:glutathione synthase/RimK-type ligase-like ATP-grasp enzyme